MCPQVPELVEIGDAVIFQRLNEEAVLLNLTTQDYYGLNDVGTHMWQLLVEHRNVESVVGRLTTMYGRDEDILRNDLHVLVQDLIKADLLQASTAVTR